MPHTQRITIPAQIIDSARWIIERATGDGTWEQVDASTREFSWSTYDAAETADRELRRIVTGNDLPDGTYRLTITTNPEYSPSADGTTITGGSRRSPEPDGWAELDNADRSFAHHLLSGKPASRGRPTLAMNRGLSVITPCCSTSTRM